MYTPVSQDVHKTGHVSYGVHQVYGISPLYQLLLLAVLIFFAISAHAVNVSIHPVQITAITPYTVAHYHGHHHNGPYWNGRHRYHHIYFGPGYYPYYHPVVPCRRVCMYNRFGDPIQCRRVCR